jgi:protein-S-isoprenylcysteine O-methyltransferase Ste14
MLEYLLIFTVVTLIFFYQFFTTVVYGKLTLANKMFGPLWTQVVTVLGATSFLAGYALTIQNVFAGTLHELTQGTVAIKVVGWIAILVSQMIYLMAQARLGESWSVETSVTDDQKLVIAGIYRFLRHPMYTSYIILAFGLYIVSPTLASFFLVLWALLMSSRFFEEERLLEKKFGKKYKDYQKNTGVFMPRIK